MELLQRMVKGMSFNKPDRHIAILFMAWKNKRYAVFPAAEVAVFLLEVNIHFSLMKNISNREYM